MLTALLILPAVGFIAYRSFQNWGQLTASAWSFRPIYWLSTLGGYILAFLVGLWVWNRIISRLAQFNHFGQNARILCLSNLSKHIPGSVWYMAGRSYLYSQVGVPASLTLAGIGLEVTVIAVAGLATYLVATLLSGPASLVPLQLGGALVLFGLTALLVQPPIFNRLLTWIQRRMGSTAPVRISYRDLWPLLLAYVLSWGIGGATLYTVVRSVYPVPWQQLPAVIGIWAASGTIGLLASTFLFGFGVRELALSVLLSALMPQPLAVVVAILFWFLLTGGDLAAAGISALLSRGKVFSGRPTAGESGGEASSVGEEVCGEQSPQQD